MKNMMLVAASLAILPLSTFASSSTCAEYGHTDRAIHCTEYVDNDVNESENIKYQMEFSLYHDDVFLGSRELCISSSMNSTLQNGALPGKYTEVYSLAYLTSEGELEYRYYDSQTYQYSGTGFASPQVFTVNLPPAAGAVLCSDEMNDEMNNDATGLEDFFIIHSAQP